MWGVRWSNSDFRVYESKHPCDSSMILSRIHSGRGHNRFQNRIGGEKERSLIDNGLTLEAERSAP